MGGSVRIAMTRRTFKKEYTCQWSEELFVVAQKLCNIQTTYRVKELVDKPIGRIATGMNGTTHGVHGGTYIK